MDFGLFCDSCQQSFDTADKVPLVLPCGQTACKECALIVQRDSYCKLCNSPHAIDDFTALRMNQKLYAIVQHTQNVKAQQQSQRDGLSSGRNEHVMLTPTSKQSVIQPNQPPVQKPIYSFQNQFSDVKPSDQHAHNMKVGYQFFMKNSPQTTNYSSNVPIRKPPLSGTNVGPQSDTMETNDKLTEGNNMSVVHEEHREPQIMMKLSNQSMSKSHRHSKSESKEPPSKYYCKIHLDKPIEYFCSQCNISVCSKCMFLHHNGHDLAQLDDALKLMLTKLNQFDEKVHELIRDSDDTRQALMQTKSEIEQLREKQQQLIDMKFKELITKLEERKSLLSREILHKYESAIFKLNDKLRTCKEQQEDVAGSKEVYKEVFDRLRDESFIKQEASMEQVQVLNRMADFDKFIYENTVKIKNFQSALKVTMMECQDGQQINLRPTDVSIQNALGLIQTIQFDGLIEYNLPSQQPSIPKARHSQDASGFNSVKLLSREQTLANTLQKGHVKMESSFTFPKNSGSSSSLQGLRITSSPFKGANEVQQSSTPKIHTPINQPPQNIQQQLLQQRSLSVQEPRVLNTAASDDNQGLKQIPPPQPYNSKFAKLKFSRQHTNQSQELCLQLDSPSKQKERVTIQESKEVEEDLLTPEEQVSAKVKVLDTAIYCIGDSRFMLMFDHKLSLWQQVYFDKKESDYQGTLKFMSITQINLKKREFMMTGGCNTSTKDASTQCFRFNIPSIRVFREVARMRQARYGHASVYVNQLLMVMGGFNHRDDEATAPITLNTCEKYSIKENEWTPLAPMQQERAYFSCCRVKEEFIYAFGGFQNYETTNSIEFYNIMLDKWTLLSITMPIKLAKYGLARVEENQIIIAGGLLIDNSSTRSTGENASYSCVNTVYKFDCNTLKWTKLAKLNFRRNMYANMPVKENQQIFAIGGTLEGINEVYDMRKKKWNTCQSYTSIVGANDLQTFAICSLSKLNDE